MDILLFFAEVTKAIAWPITLIILVTILRKPVIELIPSLRRLKYKELELEFTREIFELKAEVAEISQNKGEESILISSDSSNLLRLVSFSTRAAIMEAWLEIESASISVASSFWGQTSNEVFKNMPKLGEYLLQCKVIDEKQLTVFNKLRQLRNQVVHAQELDFSESDAKSYVQLALQLAKQIREAN